MGGLTTPPLRRPLSLCISAVAILDYMATLLAWMPTIASWLLPSLPLLSQQDPFTTQQLEHSFKHVHGIIFLSCFKLHKASHCVSNKLSSPHLGYQALHELALASLCRCAWTHHPLRSFCASLTFFPVCQHSEHGPTLMLHTCCFSAKPFPRLAAFYISGLSPNLPPWNVSDHPCYGS